MNDLPILNFHPNYRRLVLEGFKVTTIRYQNDLREGGIYIQFGQQDELFPARIVALKHKFLQDLDDTDARADGFSDHQELIGALRFYYPDLPENPELTIISFRLKKNKARNEGKEQ